MMKLNGVIFRPAPNVYLRAYILQGGKFGTNLLDRQNLTDLEQARISATAELAKKSPGVQVTWTYREGEVK